MRLKYLTLCLIGLSLGGCATQGIHPNSQKSQQLEQRAVDGLNAVFETSSYDIKGQFNIKTDVEIHKGTSADKKAINSENQLDQELKKRIDETLKAQNLKLSAKEKNALYEILGQEKNSYNNLSAYRSSSSGRPNTMQGLLAILDDLKFSYDGSVHYRQKMGALNFNLEYQKPTLQVQAKIPMVLDFKDYKYYVNYFALMPYLVNKESQNSFAYIDFSKFKADFEKVDIKKLVVYLKESNALAFALAAPDQIYSPALTAQDKKNQTVEKIGLKTDFETFLLQSALYEWVNKPYFSEQVLGGKSVADKSGAEAAEVAHASASATETAFEKHQDLTEKAYTSAERVRALIDIELDQQSAHDAEESDAARVEAASMHTEAEEDTAYATTASSDAPVVNAAAQDATATKTNERLSEQACKALLSSKSRMAVGQVNFCSTYYDIELLGSQDQSIERDQSKTDQGGSAFDRLKPLFIQYQSAQLTDAQAFSQLWKKHQVEIQDALNKSTKQRSEASLVVGLDANGRVNDIVYAVLRKDKNLGNINFLSQTQFFNYNQATPIDRKQLKDAKSMEEVSKGSMFEKFVTGISRSLDDKTAAAEQAATKDGEKLSLNERLEKIALDTYTRTGSYLKSYQAVFVLLYSVRNPELTKYYSAADLNEIAELHAYYFNETLEKPSASMKAHLERLAEKHQLKSSGNFDDVGSSTLRIVDQAMHEAKEQQVWKNILQQAKTKQNAFALQYEKHFKAEYHLNNEQGQQLSNVAKLLAQAYADDTKNKLSQNSIKGLNAEDEDFLDYGLYRKIYIGLEKYSTK